MEFLVLFTCSVNSSAHRDWKSLSADERSCRVQQAEVAEKIWNEKHSAKVIYRGSPVDSETGYISDLEFRIGPSSIGRFFVVEANGLQDAMEMFKDHPHFSLLPGTGIEVTACQKRS